MTKNCEISESPIQRLQREAYVSEQWFEREKKELFSKNWALAGVVSDFRESGDYKTLQIGNDSLIVIKDGDGQLKTFHNICRHRGTELLEGRGNTGRFIMCPYHNWVYNLDGGLRGLPAAKACFPDLDKKGVNLIPASIGIFHNLVFVNPSEKPEERFEDWLGGLDSVAWPHNLLSEHLEESEEFVYEINCNWKVFMENGLDGYHLAYLHKETLGGPLHDKNVWEPFGRHLVWWSTEREGVKHRIPQFVEKASKGATTVKDAEEPGYGGVYAIFPNTLITPNPWGFSTSIIEPVNANKILMRVRNWAPKGWLSYKVRTKDAPGYDKESGLIKSSHWKVHPLETGDFQTEDVWVCEKMQRALQSSHHSVEFLAKGSGGETALDFFQQRVLDYVSIE